MVVRLVSGDVFGIDGRAVEIEVDLLSGVSNFHISGLPGKGTRESRERIRSAIGNAGFEYPAQHRIVVNLAPAAWEKDGSAFDLPIALCLLMASEQVRPREIAQAWGVLGELSLDGSIRAAAGTLGMVVALREAGVDRVLLPAAAVPEASVVPGIGCVGVRHLRHAAAVLEGEASGVAAEDAGDAGSVAEGDEPDDFADVIGHRGVKRALVLAAAGRHNTLLVGPPGSGKTLLAKRLPGLLGPLTPAESLSVTQIHSAAGVKSGPGLIQRRPFRAPHHTVSWAGLVGGGVVPRPGEITLAHAGVLFLDELPEFPRRSLEAMREPLEEGEITIARARSTLTFPASFLLLAAMNPCPCGNHRSPRRTCHCTPERIRRYQERISGPLLDRIDLRLEVHSPRSSDLLAADATPESSTAQLRARVDTATAFRLGQGRDAPNHALRWPDRDRWAPLDRATSRLLATTADDLDLSTRALTRILRLARTIADLEESPPIEEHHLLEALDLHTPQRGMLLE